jgi:hypothetical protein
LKISASPDGQLLAVACANDNLVLIPNLLLFIYLLFLKRIIDVERRVERSVSLHQAVPPTQLVFCGNDGVCITYRDLLYSEKPKEKKRLGFVAFYYFIYFLFIYFFLTYVICT